MAKNDQIDKLLKDPKFLEYVFDGLHTEHWENYLREKPSIKEDFESARKIAKSIKFKPYQVSPEKQMLYLNRFREALGHSHQPGIPSKSSGWKNIMKIAAALAIIIASLAVLRYNYFQDKTETAQLQEPYHKMIVKIIPRQMKSSVVLNDGTVVKLNSESGLEFPENFPVDSRKVKLKGEAFFDVAPDDSRPFIIMCSNMTITVVGTSFNVRTYQDEESASVAVQSGKVWVSSEFEGKETKHELAQGQMFSLHTGDMKAKIASFDPDEMFGWTAGKLVFTNADMNEIARKLERWYDVEIEIALKRKIVKGYSGKFSNVALENILEGIGYSLGFHYKIDEKQVTIFD